MNFFNGCSNQQEAKDRYRELCKEHHPDKGGKTETMTEINRQYHAYNPSHGNFQNRQGFQGFPDFQSFQNAWRRSTEGFTPGFGTYKSNQTRTHAEVPFDHPIHQRIRNLEADINTLKTVNKDLNHMLIYWRNEYDCIVKTAKNQVRNIEDLKKTLEDAEKEIEELKKKPKRWWHHLFGVKHAE